MHQENVRNKRKVPEPNSNYPTNFYNRSINHQHTNSLPIDTVPLVPLQQNSFSGSINNINNEQYQTPTKLYEQNYSHNSANQLGSVIKQETYKSSPQKPLNNFHQNALNNNHHSKTCSLPVDMGPIVPKTATLPEGWTSEKTPTGQVYYINHITQTTTWDDPRKAYNTPVPIPAGWEEKKTQTGEVYYVNHSTQTTQWEDPRLEQQASYRNSYKENHFTASTSSLNSSISSSSSIQSLNVISSYGSPNKFKQNETTKSSNKDLIRNLQQNLDKVLAQKMSIAKQLEDLTSKEKELTSKMSKKDYNEVLEMLKYTEGQQNLTKPLNEDSLDSTLIKSEPR